LVIFFLSKTGKGRLGRILSMDVSIIIMVLPAFVWVLPPLLSVTPLYSPLKVRGDEGGLREL